MSEEAAVVFRSPLVDAIADGELTALRAQGTARSMRAFEASAQSARVLANGRSVVHFASSNYLDLAHHPEVVEAAAQAAHAQGCAAGGSRLICGNTNVHETLEDEIAAFLGVDAALVFSTGYMANLGVLTTLVRPGDVVLSDALNHASIIDGCKLARADVRVFPHGRVDALAEMLPPVADRAARDGRRVFLVVDGVYSMDGDLAPLPELTRLARRHGAVVILDDAHGVGVLGARGRGVAEALGAEGGIDVYVGTLGKALGSFGAFVAGSSRLRELLVNSARTFIFTCALPLPQIAAARAALTVIRREPERRSRLLANAERLRERLALHGIPSAPSTTQIVPVVVGENAPTMALCERLLERGYFAQGIRPPSVPPGGARLRITLMATHERHEIDGIAAAVAAELPVVLGATQG